MMRPLPFEKPIDDLYDKIEELKRLSAEGDVDLSGEIKAMEKRAEQVKQEIFSHLTPQQIMQIARHPNRPSTLGLAKLICDSFIELHGDRQFRDDPSIVGGIAELDGQRVVIIGHQKGQDTKEKLYRNFGMPHPEGYRKALRLMRMAEKFNMPILTFIDTPGAYPGKEAEERGQAEAIARNLRDMSQIKTPIITYVIGEGGSGGALGIAVSNEVVMLEYSVYSVISPEGCASILFRNADQADYAAERLRITAKDVLELGIADAILDEPFGGAHNDWASMADAIKSHAVKALSGYNKLSKEDVVLKRYEKFRQLGRFELGDAPKKSKKSTRKKGTAAKKKS